MPFATADIYVDRAIVRLAADEEPRKDIKVINNGDDVGYVEIEVFEVRNPGTEQEERVKVTDPEELKLIVSPSKLAIPANNQKLVRIVNLAPGENDERIYRVNVTPVLPPLQDDEGSVVRVVVAYQLLVIIDPANPQEDLEIRREANQLFVKNNGNTNVLISNGKQCEANEEACVDIAAHRVYPGNLWQVELEKELPATLTLTNFNGVREFRTE
ncbi:fimbrial biogenesis chaperone [Aurantivibrio infirmus]